MQPSRGKGKGRSRILYWFRTPPGVRVGRPALDEEAIRLIEANNPDLQFDWTRILKGQPDADSPATERRGPARDGRSASPERRAGSPERGGERAGRERSSGRPSPERRGRPADQKSAAEVEAAAAPVEVAAPADGPSLPEEPMTPAHARLGSEGLARTRARYAETMARISERIQDAEQQAQLKAVAERLNPDAWVTEADVAAGLESYEATFESLRGTIGKREIGKREKGQGKRENEPAP